MGDEPDQIAVPSLRVERWFKRRRRVLLILVGILAVAGFLYWFPPWAIKHAHKHAIDCTNEIYRTGTGTASDCEQGAWLAIPKLIPWTRKQALAEQSSIRGQEIEDTIDLATKRDLDRAAAARGVTMLFAALEDEPELDTTHAAYYLSKLAGDEHALIEHAADLEPGDLSEAMIVALHAGDRPALLRLAALPAKDKPSYAAEKIRGAVLCAFGDKAAGVAALEQASTIYDSFGGPSTGYLEAQLALGVCDPSTDATVDDVWSGRYRYAKQIGGAPVAPINDKYNDDADIASLVALDRAGDDRMNDYLELVAPSIGGTLKPRFEIMSPWSILSSGGDYPTAPAWNDAVAARLIGFADKFVPPKPKKHKRGDDDYEARSDEFEIADEAEKEPRPYLRWSAMVVSVDAAVAWIRRGDITHAQASIDTAIASANHADTAEFHPYSDLILIPVLHLVGRETEALAMIDAVLAKAPPANDDLHAILGLQKVLLLLHAGKTADAWAILDKVDIAAVDARLPWTIGWLKAAVALMLDKPLDLKLPAVPDERDYSKDHPDVNLAYWYTAATDPKVQPMRRWREDGLDPGYFDNWGVLPALLYVVGKAAGKGDVELWLDVVTANEIISWETLASARAEAARWRGDTAAATAWDQRLATYRALATDDRTAYLLRLAQKD